MIRFKSSELGTDHYFPPGGSIVIEKKNVCRRKNAEINCLPRGASQKKLSAETIPIMRDLGNFKKNCLHSELRKKLCKHLNDGGIKFPTS